MSSSPMFFTAKEGQVVHDRFDEMLQAVIDEAAAEEKVVVSNDERQLLFGYRVDREGSTVHSIRWTSMRLRRGVHEDWAHLVRTPAGREHIAVCLTHRHQLVEHGCKECEDWETVHGVMES